MRRIGTPLLASTQCKRFNSSQRLSPPIIKIDNGTFYRQHPSSRTLPGQNAQPNSPLFPGLTLELPAHSTPNQYWAILSPSSTIRTAFLQILRGQLLCFPPTARSYPYLLSDDVQKIPERAIEYVGFDVERKAFGGAYLSARYESRVEETDFTLAQYLTGITGLNVGEQFVRERTPERKLMERVAKDLELERFWGKPVSTLSNGQSRRARIGKALLTGPEMLLLDAPFIGLDPFVSRHISQVLFRLAEVNSPRIVLSLRPQDVIPEWITHIVYAGEDGKVNSLGPKEQVFKYLKQEYDAVEKSITTPLAGAQRLDSKLVELREVGRHLSERGDFKAEFNSQINSNMPILSRDSFAKEDSTPVPIGELIVEMEGVRIKYGTNSILGDCQQVVNGTSKNGLWWNIHRGQRWGVFGANGSGKTTLLSIITSDHPQTYSAPVRIFQRSRLPSPGQPGISIFDIQARMGHSSPEVHALFPKNLSVRRTLESAWSETPITPPKLDAEANRRVDACLRWFNAGLNPVPENCTTTLDWATNFMFGEMSFSAQRVLLFLRATVRNPDIVILDEAFSGMDDLVRDKCLLFLSHGESIELQYSENGPSPLESEISKNGNVIVPGLQEHQAFLCVSHSRNEIPGCIRDWIYLPEPGTGPPRIGKFDGPVELDYKRWQEIWGELPSQK